ncbi:MAG: efflux RND transporter periplasmic adaptor subunit [Alphaproteobacteria bacterium]
MRHSLKLLATVLALGTTAGAAWTSPSLAAIAVGALASGTVALRDLPDELQVEGVVEAINQATVTSKTAGTIIEINFDVNDFVEKGDVLLRFQGKTNRAGLKQVEAAQREAGAHLLEAQRKHRRVRELFEKEIMTASQMDQAQAALSAAIARVEAADAQLISARENVSDTVVVAPYSGYVTRRFIQLGENANIGTPLFAGLSLGKLRVIASVPQRFVEAVRERGQAVVLPLGAGGDVIQAEKIVIYPYADPKSHQFSVRLNLPEGVKELYPGELVKVSFVVGTRKRLVIPATAVAQRVETSGVYVLDAKGGVSLRHVLLGGRVGPDGMEVLSGLSAGEVVALDPILAGQRLFESRKGKAHE